MAETGKPPLAADPVFRFAAFNLQVLLALLMAALAWGRVVADNAASFFPYGVAALAALVVWVGSAAFTHGRTAAAHGAAPDGTTLGEIWRLSFTKVLYVGARALLALLVVSAAFLWPLGGQQMEQTSRLVGEGVLVLVSAMVLLKLAFGQLVRAPAIGGRDYVLMGVSAAFAAYFFYDFAELVRFGLRGASGGESGTLVALLIAGLANLGAALPLFLAGLLQAQDGNRRGSAFAGCWRRFVLCLLGLLIGSMVWPHNIGVELVHVDDTARVLSWFDLTGIYPTIILLLFFLIQDAWLLRTVRPGEAALSRRVLAVTAVSLAIAWAIVRLLQQARL
jgi:hypothetical protein